MEVSLAKLAHQTIFTYRGMTLRKASTSGPCDPATLKCKNGGGKGTVYGLACDLKVGGQWQTDSDLQVWVPETALVEVN